jgi:hypothetical protein
MANDVEAEAEATEEQADEGPEGMLETGSEKMWPNRQEDEQDMEMEPVIMAPPGYGSPDPATQEGTLVPVEESPLELGEDYGSNVGVSSEVTGLSEEAASESSEEEEGRPANSATRAEWDEFARSKGVDPDEYGSKDDLIAALS